MTLLVINSDERAQARQLIDACPEHAWHLVGEVARLAVIEAERADASQTAVLEARLRAAVG